MKIALAQINPHIGNFQANGDTIIELIKKAREQEARLVVFPELSISGYPPRDFLDFDDFIKRCEESALRIARECTEISAIVGLPVFNQTGKGKRLFNAAVLLKGGKICEVSHKALLPNYDVFDEYRYFEQGRDFLVWEFEGERLAVTICEDLWNVGEKMLYTFSPMDKLAEQQPTLMINIAASPFHSEQANTRLEILRSNTCQYNIPLIYVNQVGAQTELLFDGGSLALSATGIEVRRLSTFSEDFQIVDTRELNSSGLSLQTHYQPERIALIHDALVMGIRDYFNKMGFKKAILGLSGGIDSAVVLVLAARALGADNVWGVLLPSRYSSDHSVSDAVEISDNLGTRQSLVPIEEAFNAFEHTLQPIFAGTSFGLAEENMQARSRAVILMALSNKFGYILLNTSNKSEAAVGYGTLYGDMCGGLSVIGDVYKTDVYALARYINRSGAIIPENIISKPPSAELRPDQKDSDSLPDYDILDQILYKYIEKFEGPDQIIADGFDATIVNKTLRMVNTNEYKRHQTPPILRVSTKAFGMGRRMPLVAKYLG
jgi:NAD+ synthase (glutamine-hydrolysing)